MRLQAASLLRWAPLAAEVAVVVLWSLVVAWPLLDLDPNVVPIGGEYLSAIQSHHVWLQARECGPCAFWNGGVRGGAPAFADPYGSLLHPLVVLGTLGWGMVNGSKIALLGAFLMAGLAQLWLGAVTGLSRPARTWAACMAVAGGHLASRGDQGTFGLILSTAACSLVLPPLIGLARTASLRTAVLLGVTGGLALLAGQAYMQLGLALILPGLLFLLPWARAPLGLLARRALLAAAIALLIAAPFLLPFLHFAPQFGKDIDPYFTSSQPLAFVPLNLVIDDPAFFRSELLGKLPYPYLYANYVGWVPLLLALLGLARWREEGLRPLILALAALAALALWVASGAPFIWLAAAAPGWLANQAAGVRHSPVIASLAVPPILALAALGVDRLLRAPWPSVQLTMSHQQRALSLSSGLRWLLLIPLLGALYSAWVFSQNWTLTRRLDANHEQLLAGLATPSLQWVNTPYGESGYVASAVERGLKLAEGIRPWNWSGRSLPAPLVEAHRTPELPGFARQAMIADIAISRGPASHEYAQVLHADGSASVCAAQGRGGDLDVRCALSRPGVLVVQENSWTGWAARLDGRPLALEPGQWLSVTLPAGEHSVAFRYRPWDAPIGLLLSAAGVGLAAYGWRRAGAEGPG